MSTPFDAVMTQRSNRTYRSGRGTARWRLVGLALAASVVGVFGGCGSTKSRTATEQLLMSDALDRAVSQIDFSELAGQTVFFDTKYVINTKDPQFIGNQKGLGFVNAEYVISSLRQQMVASGLKLQDKLEEADYVVEARLGAVGFDNNEVIYGIPASSPISAATALVPNVPAVALPELSIAKKVLNVGAAKVGVFAYDRKTREAVWQAGISQAASDSRDVWVLGVGPFQRGTIYRDGTQFAGTRLRVPNLTPLPELEEEVATVEDFPPVDVDATWDDPLERFTGQRSFRHLLTANPKEDGAVRPAEFLEPVGGAQPIKPPAADGTAKASTESAKPSPPAPAPAPAAAAAPAPAPTTAATSTSAPTTAPTPAPPTAPTTTTTTTPTTTSAPVNGSTAPTKSG